ncbi:B12-binding domain-containing protein [Sphingomonas sp.]|uniref:cobalamin B12-binding domain-containing protein n=1 Tax=Sphingomonas sp. TaxID=28214 RepID=UPI0035BBE0EA
MTSMMRADIAHTRSTREHATHGQRLAAFRIHLDQDYAQSLSALIESEIIPRLVVAHAADPFDTLPALPGDVVVTAVDIETLVPLSLQVEADTLIVHVEAILTRGVPIDAVLVDLLAPAARLLGEYWEEDRCDFVDVTMALWRLQEVIHELSARMPSDGIVGGGGHSALFASMPGDQHSFGTVVIDELFRREGWRTDRMSNAETPDLLRRVADDWFDMIGLTVSCDCHIANLGSVIVALRNVSRNPRVCVMVGGRIFGADPALAEQVGADGTARDAKLALKLADSLVRARAREAVA